MDLHSKVRKHATINHKALCLEELGNFYFTFLGSLKYRTNYLRFFFSHANYF